MLDVKYAEIRSNVIAKLQEQYAALVKLVEDFDITNDLIECHIEGDAAKALNALHDSLAVPVCNGVNIAISQICQQLEDVCVEFETVDADINSKLGVGAAVGSGAGADPHAGNPYWGRK